MNPPATNTRSRIAAWLLLLVYGLSLPGAAPVALASLAVISGSHNVEMVFKNGHLDVVMRHHDDDDHHHHDDTDAADHHDDDHHNQATDGLTKLMIGIAAHDHDEDHVLHFATSDEAFSFNSTALNVPLATAACVPWQGISFQPEWPARDAMPRHAARPPPRASIGLLCLRTTMLLV